MQGRKGFGDIILEGEKKKRISELKVTSRHSYAYLLGADFLNPIFKDICDRYLIPFF